MVYYKILTAAIGLLFLAIIIQMIRRDYLHPNYSIWWLFTGICISLLGIFPELADFVAPFLGIRYPPILVMIIGLVVIFFKSLISDIERTKNRAILRKLTQEVSILKEELACLKQQMEDSDRR
ncbi:DUF2304 domain-containing protein [Thermodesulforhabdus norvegica]|uniref:DUF2304 domain-containing protein n=1 Tax=Thermodesulforhabdus norvegica TaxID=39841 RepID=A0A1I4SSP0_9BACT|nr:DUF2304 domain-containing protein [Thermodesulforhabdus norvegica]SFM67431.1 hypothetical protein SAMN05660836_01141 [Thermodesulforhabdus norvegica]